MQKFDLIHATRRDAVDSIQYRGIQISAKGFFGPAAYFYADSPEGNDLAHKFLDKKIKTGGIRTQSECVILSCSASCADANFFDGLEIADQIEEVAYDACVQAWNDLKDKNWSREDKTRYVNDRMNNARNKYIADVADEMNVEVKIFRGKLKDNETCYAVRSQECISLPPYEMKDYYGKTIA